MAKACTTEKTASRQRWIEEGLLELMQKDRFEDITVAALCRHLSLSRRSFYRYFEDLEDVLDSLMHHTFQDFASPNTVLNIRELQINFQFWLEHRSLLQALAISGLNGKLSEYALRYTDEEALKKYLVTSDLGMDISREVNLFVIHGLSSLIIAWYAEDFPKTPEQMAAIAHRMLSAPILLSR